MLLEFGCDAFDDYLKHDEIKMLQLDLLMVKNHVIPFIALSNTIIIAKILVGN